MQSPLEMPEPTSLQQDWVRRFLAVPELLLVVLAGPLLVQIVFLIIGIDVFENTQSVVLFMATEATFSLILIMLCLSYRGEGLSKVGWVWASPACPSFFFPPSWLVCSFKSLPPSMSP